MNDDEQQQQNFTRVEQLIQTVERNNLDIINLESIDLRDIPTNIYRLSNLTKLYLYGNSITNLPENFFESLVLLNWLDLRHNELREIPRSIINLALLKNLLIGCNLIKRLPIEIGGLKELSGLNFDGNPLEFPIESINLKGAGYVIHYLQMCYHRKERLRRNREDTKNRKNIESDFHEVGSDNRAIKASVNANVISFLPVTIDERRYESELDALAINDINTKISEIDQEQQFCQQSNELKPKAYREAKREFHKRLKSLRMHSPRNVWAALPSQSQRHVYLFGDEPEPLTLEQVQKHRKEQRRRSKRQHELIRQDAVIQKAKDSEKLCEWKKEYRRIQKNLVETYREIPEECIKMESRKRIQYAPFRTNKNELAVMQSQELMAEKSRPRPAIAKDPLPENLSKCVLLKMEIERLKKDDMLCEQINRFSEGLTAKSHEPIKGSRSEIEDAQFDLTLALQLQTRLKRRQDVLTQLRMTTHPTAFL